MLSWLMSWLMLTEGRFQTMKEGRICSLLQVVAHCMLISLFISSVELQRIRESFPTFTPDPTGRKKSQDAWEKQITVNGISEDH